MNVEIKSVEFENFKKFQSLSLGFSNKCTVYGKNRDGKSTIPEGVIWCFTGKDLSGGTKSRIRTQDEDGNPIRNTDISVAVTLVIDGIDKVFKRTEKEQYTVADEFGKKKLKGNKTKFSIDSVPYDKTGYEKELAYTIQGDNFSILTNPLRFNSLKRDEQRSILFSLASDKAERRQALIEKLIVNDVKYDLLNTIAAERKTIEQKNAELVEKIRLAKKEFEGKEERIKEQNHGMPEFVEVEPIKKQKKDLEKQIKLLEDSANADEAKAGIEREKRKKLQSDLKVLESQLHSLELKLTKSANKGSAEKQTEKDALENRLEAITKDLNSNDVRVTKLRKVILANTERQDVLRGQFADIEAETFVPSDPEKVVNKCSDPHCPYHENEMELINNEESIFNVDVAKKKEEINKEGQELAGFIKEDNKEIETLKQSQSVLLKEQSQKLDSWKAIKITNVEFDPMTNAEYSEIWAKCDALEKTFNEQIEETTDKEVETKIAKLRSSLNEAVKVIDLQKDLQKRKTRIEELRNEMKSVSVVVLDLESQKYIVDNFFRAEMKTVEEEVNKMFNHVKFRLFEDLYNGSYKDVCECLLDGVPFNDLNTEGKNTAGIDIINTLSEKKDLYFPIFIDNRESITEIPDTQCQIINLVVDPTCDKLIVK